MIPCGLKTSGYSEPSLGRYSHSGDAVFLSLKPFSHVTDLPADSRIKNGKEIRDKPTGKGPKTPSVV